MVKKDNLIKKYGIYVLVILLLLIIPVDVYASLFAMLSMSKDTSCIDAPYYDKCSCSSGYVRFQYVNDTGLINKYGCDDPLHFPVVYTIQSTEGGVYCIGHPDFRPPGDSTAMLDGLYFEDLADCNRQLDFRFSDEICSLYVHSYTLNDLTAKQRTIDGGFIDCFDSGYFECIGGEGFVPVNLSDTDASLMSNIMYNEVCNPDVPYEHVQRAIDNYDRWLNCIDTTEYLSAEYLACVSLGQ